MNQVSLFLMKPSCLCLSAFSLLSCAPYEKCDESLKVGDELTFKLTEGPSEQEQIDECEVNSRLMSVVNFTSRSSVVPGPFFSSYSPLDRSGFHFGRRQLLHS